METSTNTSDAPSELKINQRRWIIDRHRKQERQQVTDSQRFGLGEVCMELAEFENLTEKDVAGIASRIKRRKKAETSDLVKLSNAFIRSPANITTFIKITGAINVLVKELSGQNASLQNLAAECLCNLALGDDVCCEKVVIFAGTYLVAYLHNVTDTILNITCLWTIQNLIIGGQKAFKILQSQQVVPQILALTENTFSEELQNESLKALDIILLEEHDTLSLEEKHSIVSTIARKFLNCYNLDVLKLLHSAIVVAGCRFEVEDSQQIVALIARHLFVPMDDFKIDIIYSIRVLANLTAGNSDIMKCFVEYLVVNNLKLSQLYRNLAELDVEFVVKELLWCISNVLKSSFGLDYLQYDDLFEQIK